MRRVLTPLGITGFALLALILFLAVFAPSIWGDRATTVDVPSALQGSSSEHWLGTDALGRDLFARVLVATRLSLELAAIATVIRVAVGLLLGTAPMFLGRRLGGVVMAAVTILVAFPALLVVLFLATIFGVGATGAVLAIGLAGAPSFARLCHTLFASVEASDYIAAARTAGVSRPRILFRHVLPNVAEPLVVSATIDMGYTLLAFAGLSFLGLGVQVPSYDWGQLMQDNLSRIYTDPLAAIGPGLAVVIAGLAFNFIGEAVARSFGTRDDVRRPVAPPRRVPASLRRQDQPDLLTVEDLRVDFTTSRGVSRPVRGVSFSVKAGEAVGIVGESGSGKSMTALAVAGLVDEAGVVDAGRLSFDGADLLDGGDHRRLLGTSLAMVFQDPMTSFNPAHRIGAQLAEVGRTHQALGRRVAWARAVDRLQAVRVREPERRARQYPFEFSGGMRQRAMLAMGLMGSPRLVIADEPTTALDVTVQKEVLALLGEIREQEGAALLFISHDVSVVREVCDRVLVMYAGRIVEDLPASELDESSHPYTRALVAAVPHMETDTDRPLAVIPGQMIDPSESPAGCAFAARCPRASVRCGVEEPVLEVLPSGARVACWHPGEARSVLMEKAEVRR
ncbi:peptide ABC transporter ATP-binding protein [Nocardioides sp. Root190]|uniref:dipeptide/oligopeptide/nickel ABC transporter permease/ATP-binding protein n=1 Tax=Nocardioides sp. Root190 TaxID=1736488 RepID=UPI0006F7FEBD|nr:dipeptide/oligopeptide/nickel ABC transporter permease/ATP-binding protein [Nocardioides sp. Root190]KRB73292.1 peptide ABC transporter ATP-binding protein [Nocardioides sp. Root190]